MKAIIDLVLDKYIDAYHRRIPRGDIADAVVYQLPQSIVDLGKVTNKYQVHGSVGMGHWSGNPWVGIFDKEVTTSAKRGYYIVYLFDAKMGGVYLSLNQGWTQYHENFKPVKKAREQISSVTKTFKGKLISGLSDFSYDSIQLNPISHLGEGYELGHICGKFYKKGEIPGDAILVDDLRNLIGVYRELKGIVGLNILEPKQHQFVRDEMEDEINIDEIVSIDAKIAQLSAIEAKNRYRYNPSKIVQFDAEHDLQKNKSNAKVGKAAELIVVRYEKDRLTQAGRLDLAEKVKQVSDNQALGYDVLSYEVDGKERSIEVKGTTGSSAEFPISGYELEASRHLNYYVYHILKVRSATPTITILQHPAFSLPYFDVQPMLFNVRYHQ